MHKFDKPPACFDTKEFYRLRDEWYSRAAEDGFQDIEKIDRRTKHIGSDGRAMGGNSPTSGDLYRNLYRKDKEDYYYWVRDHASNMADGLVKTVWELHGLGLSERRIQAILAHHMDVRPSSVSRIVKTIKPVLRARCDSSFEVLDQDEGAAGALTEALGVGFYETNTKVRQRGMGK